jgi:hypothetical protein
MIWNVYEQESNSREIKVFNIFNHHSFNESVKRLKRQKLPKDEFAVQLKRELMYYFWSKCEYEVVVTTFPPYITEQELDRVNKEQVVHFNKYGRYPKHLDITPETAKKIDIYDQVCLNWDVFVDYVWGKQDM